MEIWARCQDVIKGAPQPRPASRPRTSPRSASPTSARRRSSGTRPPASRSTTRSSGRTPAPRTSATPSRRTAARIASGRRPACPLATYFSGPKVKWILDNVDGRPGQGRGGRPPLRQHRHLVHLEPDRRPDGRRPRDGRLQRQPHAHVQLHHARLGSRDPRAPGRAADDAPGRQGLLRGLRQGRRRPRRRPGRRRPRRPAGRPLRPDVLLARRGEEHLRHGLLHAPQHGHEGGPEQERPPHHPRLQDRRPAGRVRARGLDRDHRRPRPVAPRQPRA